MNWTKATDINIETYAMAAAAAEGKSTDALLAEYRIAAGTWSAAAQAECRAIEEALLHRYPEVAEQPTWCDDDLPYTEKLIRGVTEAQLIRSIWA